MDRYVVVRWPESRDFMEFPESRGPKDTSRLGAYPITDTKGEERFGPGACFVEEAVYLAGHRAGSAEKANLVDIFLEEARADAGDSGLSARCLKEYYGGANQMQRAAINETLVTLCGHSYETLLEMENGAVSRKGDMARDSPVL